MLYLDGGVALVDESALEFAGFTVRLYNANLGGFMGANAKCDADFPGSHFCAGADYDLSNTPIAPPSSGAWIDWARETGGRRYAGGGCMAQGDWFGWTSASPTTNTSGSLGLIVRPAGPQPSTLCSELKPIACCRGRTVRFRGFTSTLYNGNLGGFMGANAKCHAEFPGSYFCTGGEYDLSNTPIAPPSSGAWIDAFRETSGRRQTSGTCMAPADWFNWTSGSATTNTGSTSLGLIVRPAGRQPSTLCSELKPLACCSRR